MRALFKIIAFGALTGIAGLSYYMYQNNLNPLDTEDLKKVATTTKSRFDNVQDAIKAAGEANGETVIYKRRDASGKWYYTNEPPEAGEESEKLTYRSDTNVLPKLSDDGKKPD